MDSKIPSDSRPSVVSNHEEVGQVAMAHGKSQTFAPSTWSAPKPWERRWPGFEEPHYLKPLSNLEWTCTSLALLAFASLMVLGMRALLKSGKSSRSAGSPTQTGLRMRRVFAACLVVANALRCLFLGVLLLTDGGDSPPDVLRDIDDNKLQWALDLLQFLPAFASLTAFSIVAQFGAQLHYTMAMKPSLHDCVYISLNTAAYLLFAVVASCAFWLKAYSHMKICLMSLVGVLSVAVAGTCVYYWATVVSELSEPSNAELPRRPLILGMTIFSVLCPGSVLARGVVYFAWGTSLFEPSRLSDIGMCLLGEWLPCATALAALSLMPSGSARGTGDVAEDSSDSDSPGFLDGERGPKFTLPGEPGTTWRQLWPKPPSSSAAALLAANP